MLSFTPLIPERLDGRPLQSISIYVRDHKQRELPIGDRTVEAHYEGFVLSQSRHTKVQSRHRALEVSYGPDAREAQVVGRPGRLYEMGPEVADDDVDGRMPSVLAWHDGELFCLLASASLPAAELVSIANALYRGSRRP